MKKLTWLGSTLCLLLAAAALSADAPSAGAKSPAAEAAPAQSQPETDRPALKECVRQCDAAETQCSTDVRRARQECSRRAATGGRDPMTMQDEDLAYFCGYFETPARCGSGFYSGRCAARFQERYGLCLDVMEKSVMALRHDCYKAEREAQNFCRQELRDCKAECQ